MISLQVTITQISMKLTNDNEVVAYASIVFNDSVKINGVKIKKNDVGKLLVLLPEFESQKLQYVVPLTHKLRQHIDEQLIEHYFKLKKNVIKNANENIANQKGNGSNGN